MNASEFSVRQHILVNLLYLLILLAGLLTLSRLPVDFFPDISFHTANISTEWTGASADEIERLVTTKLEEELKTVAGIKEIRSTSSADFSSIDVEWRESLSDQEYARALANLRGALERVDDLPEDAEEPILRELSVAEVFASVVVAVVDEGGVGEPTMRAVARDLGKRLRDLPGVRRVTERGLRDRELRVIVDGDAAIAADVTLLEISDVIRRNNQNLPAGSFTAAEGETTVRATGDFTTPEALAATVIKKHPDGSHITLGEVARVEPGFAKQRLVARYNGAPAMNLEIAKEDDADLVTTVERVKAFLAERQPLLPAGVRVTVTQDSAPYITQQLDGLRQNLLFGIGVVIAILWFTLGMRNALLAVASIPFSYLFAIIFFPVFDITINSMSIVGMILVSGMLVDDSIVVLENIYRYVEQDLPLREAIVRGASEVQWPVIASVATTIAAFAPLLLISGTSGEFMSILPKTVILCLLASLVECLFSLPAHYLDFGDRGHHRAAAADATAARRWAANARLSVDAGLERLRARYARGLLTVLDHRAAFFGLLLGVLVFTAGVASRLPVDMFAGEYSDFFISVYGPTSYSIEQTDAVMREVEALLDEFGADEIRDYSTYAGFSFNPDTMPINGPQLGAVLISMADTRENRERPELLLQRVKARVDAWWAANPDKAENVLTLPPRNGPPLGKPVAVQIRAEDYRLAKEVAGEMKAYLARLPGVFNVEDNLLPGPREVRLAMDETRASLHGLTFQELALALRGAADGLVSSTFKDPKADEDIDIVVQSDERARRSEYDLLEAEVRAPDGRRVRLGDVAALEVDRGFLSLGHHASRRSVIVYADVQEGVATSESANRALMEQFTDLPRRYPGVEVVYGGEFQATAEAFADMNRIFPLAILLIYVILAAQFRSYLQPLIVMSAVPIGVVGIILGLLIFGYPFSFPVMYVVVGLAGVVVNDALVLTDFMNRAVREDGLSLRDAVVAAGRTRLRAILLTSTTTMGALVPTAMGLFGRSLTFGPLAAAFAIGLFVATLYNLFVIPTLYYSLMDVLQRRERRNASRLPVTPHPVLPPQGGKGPTKQRAT